MPNAPTDEGSKTYYEQQLEILLSAAPDMEQFPAIQFIEYGRQLNRPVMVRLLDSVHKEMVTIERAIELATTRYGWSSQGPFHNPTWEWNDVIWAAQQWYLNRMTGSQAADLYRMLTGDAGCPHCDERPTIPRRLDIPLMIKCGLRAGFPEKVTWRLGPEPSDEHAPIKSDEPIASSFRSSLCYFLDWRFEGSRLWFTDSYSILDLGPWLPMFQRFQNWWEANGPILPEPAPEPVEEEEPSDE